MNAYLDTPQVSLCHRVTTSGHSVSNHPLPSRCAVWGFLTIGLTGGIVLWTIRTLAGRASFGLRLSLAGSPRQQAESSLRRLVSPACATDWSFASDCSPPRLPATQLPSATGCQTYPGEDFHLADVTDLQAH